MKKLFYIVLPLFLVFSFVSCSSFVNEKTGSLTIQFNAEDLKAAKARAADTTGFTDGYLISLNISGGYDYSEIIDLSSDTTYSATFNSISVGSDIKVDVNVFQPYVITSDMIRSGDDGSNNDFYYHSFKGGSSTTIKAGSNIIEIPLDSLLKCTKKNSVNDPDLKFYSYSLDTLYWNLPSTTIYFFKNGKYQIFGTHNVNSLQGVVYSEGTWEGDFSVMQYGGNIKLTEYIYVNLVQGEEFQELPSSGNYTFTIVKKPKTQTLRFERNEDEMMIDYIDPFTSGNGVTYEIQP